MSDSKRKLYEFYESIKQGNKCFSAEELDVAIESLKLAQQTLKQSNRSNLQEQKLKPKSEDMISCNFRHMSGSSPPSHTTATPDIFLLSFLSLYQYVSSLALSYVIITVASSPPETATHTSLSCSSAVTVLFSISLSPAKDVLTTITSKKITKGTNHFFLASSIMLLFNVTPPQHPYHTFVSDNF